MLLLAARVFLEDLDYPLKLLVERFLRVLLFFRAPGVLFAGVETPDDYVAASAPVIVPCGVVGAPALGIGGCAEEGMHCGLELLEEY